MLERPRPIGDNPAGILRWVSGITFAVVILILLYTSSKAYFLADDFCHLATAMFRSSANPVSILTEPEFSGHYRPIIKVIFALNFALSGLNPMSYHVTAIFIFLATVCMFYFFVRTVSRNSLQANAAVLLLVLQPNNYLYTVNWIGAVGAILVSLFVMLSILFYIKSFQRTPFSLSLYVVSLICFMAGLLIKENALIVIVLLFAYDLLFAPRDTLRVRSLIGTLPRYIPFVSVLILYLILRDFSGAPELVTSERYRLSLGGHVLSNGFFYGQQLGFIVAVVLVFSLPSLIHDHLRFTRNELRIILFGLFMALVSVLPMLLLSWTSPTWLFLPSVGITIAISVVFCKVLEEGIGNKAQLVLWGVLISAILGGVFLFWRLDEARWLQWGPYTRNTLEEIKQYYPNLPPAATIYFIDGNKGKEYGVDRLLRDCAGSALQIWYGDPTLESYIVQNANDLENWTEEGDGLGRTKIVFEYYDGHLNDRTSEIP